MTTSNTIKIRDKSKLVMGLLVAALLWFIMFSPWTSPHVNFWVCMTASALILTCLAFAFGGSYLSLRHSHRCIAMACILCRECPVAAPFFFFARAGEPYI